MKPTATLAGLIVGGDAPARIMAAINVSPESFYQGSVHAGADALRDAARRAQDEGADLIDIGARSTAPYRDTALALDEEARRMRWAVDVVVGAVSLPVSADTTRAAVAVAALAAGARVINDVSGLRDDPAMADMAAQGAGVVLMAAPDGGADAAPLALVRRALSDSLARAARAGIARDEIVLDPGIGFFTTSATPAGEFNCVVLRQLAELESLGCPLLVGVSRKRFIGTLIGRDGPGDRLAGSLAATAVAVLRGAAMIRTHDVAATRDAVRVAAALR
ncbi:MAG TPA: dihydropteroate synthase [Candidatus Dormibacteraeota bacterium]|nr:dihydropteroate synthase [Candidatus Dormibacteraeota bacterium]